MALLVRLLALAALVCAAHAFSPAPLLRARPAAPHAPSAKVSCVRCVVGMGMSAAGGGETAQEAYVRGLRERREAIERGEGMDYATSPELMEMMVENRDALFDDSDLGEEEIIRLREASQTKLAIANGIQGMNDAAAAVVDPEEEKEFERALLDMFLKQGDIDAEALDKSDGDEDPTGSVGEAATEPDFEAMFRRDIAKLRASERVDERIVVELDQPLGLEDSQELLRQMGKYQDMEKDVWKEVAAEAESEGFTAPEKFQETFKID